MASRRKAGESVTHPLSRDSQPRRRGGRAIRWRRPGRSGGLARVPANPPTAFQRATAVTRPDPNRAGFAAELPASWAAPTVPQGGISLAATARAMQASLPSFRDPLPEDFDVDRTPFPIWVHHVEGRSVIGHPPWEAYVPTSSLRAQYQRFDEPPRLADGSIDPLALVALCDTMPGAVAERMGNTGEHPWYGPSADLTVHLTGTARSSGSSPAAVRAPRTTATRPSRSNCGTRTPASSRTASRR